MRRGFLVGVMVVAIGGGVMLQAQARRSADVEMKAAQQKADVQGDLKGAIDDYKRIVANAQGNRGLAAEALVRMAECYQKLGDEESRKIYEQIVREYGDQRDAVATARARLGGAASGQNAVTARAVWTGPNVDTYGSVSADGRLIAFTDWNTGDLAVHELTTGRDRRLTGKKGWDDPAFAMGSAISRDGREIAYGWSVVSPTVPGANHFAEVRVIDAAGGAPRSLFTARDLAGAYVHDWSGDGRWLAVELRRADGTVQIALLSVPDGALRVLKSVDARGTSRIAFSPDGRFVAYDTAVDSESAERQIHLMEIERSRETPALTHPANDRLLAWFPDGGHLLFASDRSGTSGMWALAIADGKPQGEPSLIRSDVNPSPLGFTRSGVFYYGVAASTPEIYVASADFDTGKVLAAPTVIPRPYAGLIDFPQWSPDGTSLAYLSRRGVNSRNTRMDALIIRSMDTGTVRQLNPNLPYLNAFATAPLWTPDSRFLLVTAADNHERTGIFRIDAQTGKADPIVLGHPENEMIAARVLSRDGRTLVLSRRDLNSGEVVLVARDMTSGSEREITRRKGTWGRGIDLSPDGTTLVVGIMDPGSTALFLIPMAGGEPRALLRVSGPEAIIGSMVKWSSDGKSILFAKDKGDGSPRELWRISAAGGPARKVNVNGDWVPSLAVNGHAATSFHPDGHRVAFVMGQSRLEVWSLDVLAMIASKR